MFRTKSKTSPMKAVIGLNYGNEGKGSIVNYLTHSESSIGVKVNGDYSSSHTVSTFKRSTTQFDPLSDREFAHVPDYKTFTFRQLSSGALNKRCKTYIGPQFILDLDTIYRELNMLSSKFEITHKVYIDNRAKVNLPIYHSIGYEAKRKSHNHIVYDCTAVEVKYIESENCNIPEITIGKLKEIHQAGAEYTLKWLNEYSAKYAEKRLNEIFKSDETAVKTHLDMELSILDSGNKTFVTILESLLTKVTFVDSILDIPNIESSNIVFEMDQGLFVNQEKCPIKTDVSDLVSLVNELNSNIINKGLELIFVTRSYKTVDSLGYSDYINDEIAPDYYMYDGDNNIMYDSLNYELDLESMNKKLLEQTLKAVSEINIQDKYKISSRLAVTHLDETQGNIITKDGNTRVEYLSEILDVTDTNFLLSYGKTTQSIIEYQAK
jgi:hypothetical protein